MLTFNLYVILNIRHTAVLQNEIYRGVVAYSIHAQKELKSQHHVPLTMHSSQTCEHAESYSIGHQCSGRRDFTDVSRAVVVAINDYEKVQQIRIKRKEFSKNLIAQTMKT